MKKVFLFSAGMMVLASGVSGQVSITPTTTVTTAGNVQVVLSDIDLNNAGFLDATGSTFLFTGTGDNSITDVNTNIVFNNVTINKTIGKMLNLHATLYIHGQVNFISGNIDINDKYINLGNTGSFVGESETSRATSTKYGLINATAVLNAPNAVNIANLGAVVTSTADLGMISISRFHNPVDVAGGGKGINRTYEFNPTNNQGINATLSFKYFDAELNGLDENKLTQFHSTDFVSYNNMNYSSRDAASNYVSQTGYNSIYKFTLGNLSAALPVVLLGFSAKCAGDFIRLNWQTATEQNSDRFDIQRSTDGSAWGKIGSVKSAGNSNAIASYQYDDKALNPASAYYRLVQYDIDGKVTYSSIVRAGCNQPIVFKVVPNPVADIAHVMIGGIANKNGILRLFNATGQQMMQQNIALTGGINQYPINASQLSKGIYSIVIEQNGEIIQSTKLIKQ